MTDQTARPEYKWCPVWEAIFRNSARHYKNALKYYDQDNLTFARGSLKKAIRNFKRAGFLLDPWQYGR